MNVSRILLLASLWIGLTGGSRAVAAGRDEAATVALVDIAMVFTKHERFKQRMEGLTKKAQGIQKELVDKEQAIVKQREQLKDLVLGSPEFKRLEEEVAREISDHHVTKQIKQKEIREEDARIHYETYKEIEQEVARLAQQSGVTLVMRFESQEIDQRNPQAVQLGVNRMVIYHGDEMDMTPYVIKAFNQQVATVPTKPTGTTNGPRAKTGPR